uniref:Uncharacterized protein n=4 Tax=Enterobacterales TaxID=91347 RepID=A0A384ZT77_ECOLX|nr:hypothetical protein [Enterobacter cloacae]AXE42692.1 hypothetical protein [Citrobacter portucalensis]AXE42751.1 hypothetical protein [Escherichia coli]QIS31407.1 hypothetical protein 1602GM000040 [Serratia marcescens]
MQKNRLNSTGGLTAACRGFSGLSFTVDGKQQGYAREQIRHDLRFFAVTATVQPAPTPDDQPVSEQVAQDFGLVPAVF